MIKYKFSIFPLLIFCFFNSSISAETEKPSPNNLTLCEGLLNNDFQTLQEEKTKNLCDFSGNVILIVNTASFCGFTKQYRGLEDLYEKYRNKGFVVLGFPSNDFGKQEPGSNKQIAEFCENTYGVKFPMFAKSTVKGPNANKLFYDLALKSEEPRWNFHKYLIDKNGKFVKSYSSFTSPLSRRLIKDIEKLLSTPS